MPPYAKVMLGSLGQRVGVRASLDCFTEISFKKDSAKIRPDGLIHLDGGRGRIWTCCVETKIKNANIMKYRTDGEKDELTRDPGQTGHDTREPAAAARRPAKAVLDDSGRIRVPEDVLRAWSAESGDELIVRLEGDKLRVLTRRAGLTLARRIFRRYVEPGDSLADELIRERRNETAGRNG